MSGLYSKLRGRAAEAHQCWAEQSSVTGVQSLNSNATNNLKTSRGDGHIRNRRYNCMGLVRLPESSYKDVRMFSVCESAKL